MGLDLSVFLTYAGAIILLFIFGKLFLWPLKIILKLAVNSLIGGAAILLINIIGAEIGIIIPLNMLNALIVGVLGLPGAILLIVLTIL
ncbi:MAG: pro-sigmaK processing inhibitor BofA family protein [Candidatus Fimisoma sp.]|nr:pro-sigmaK processing inhibitor BofA family protein [Bacillota bacterium]MDD7284389.1 pro-sigmaK processing inhibitor BofA family protein [Bacillota bacterium]MDY4748085.1 pro-sigmaK processing inhibitor BofA family protein [Candidatus Fimisoma sp.]